MQYNEAEEDLELADEELAVELQAVESDSEDDDAGQLLAAVDLSQLAAADVSNDQCLPVFFFHQGMASL